MENPTKNPSQIEILDDLGIFHEINEIFHEINHITHIHLYHGLINIGNLHFGSSGCTQWFRAAGEGLASSPGHCGSHLGFVWPVCAKNADSTW